MQSLGSSSTLQEDQTVGSPCTTNICDRTSCCAVYILQRDREGKGIREIERIVPIKCMKAIIA